MYHICCPLVCLVLVLLNSAILDFYLIRDSTGRSQYMWIIADIAVIGVFLTAFVKAYKYFKQDKVDTPQPTGRQCYIGNLPFSYISWFTFSVFMSAKVYLIYKLPNSIVSQAERCKLTTKECTVFGPNTLKGGISLAALVFKMLVFSHIDVETSTAEYDFSQRMVGIAHLDIIGIAYHDIIGIVHLDILDTTQFLDAFSEDIVGGIHCLDKLNTTQFLDAFNGDSNATVNVAVNAAFNTTVNAAVNATFNATVNAADNATTSNSTVYYWAQFFTCVNYILPTVAIFFLAWSRSSFSPLNRKWKLFCSVFYYLIINVPLLIIRIIIWSGENMEISVFIVKNVIAIAKTCQVLLCYLFIDSSCAHMEYSPESNPLVMESLLPVGEVNVNSPQIVASPGNELKEETT